MKNIFAILIVLVAVTSATMAQSNTAKRMGISPWLPIMTEMEKRT